jgi:large subunit ribosomal protein L40e
MAAKSVNEQPASQARFKPSHIFIKSLTGRVLVLPVHSRSTIRDLMVCIENNEGIRIDLQRLTFAGKQLCPNFSLAEYNILDESTLHLSSRLLGGQLAQWQQIIVYISVIIFGIPIFAKLKQLIMQQIAMLTAAEEWDEEGGDEDQ